MNYLLVFLGGGAGSMLRFFFASVNTNADFPYHTLWANVLSSLILGGLFYAMTELGLHKSHYALLAVGFCGGFSTFSTFSLESMQILQGGHYTRALTYVLSNILLSFTAIALGFVAVKFFSTNGS